MRTNGKNRPIVALTNSSRWCANLSLQLNRHDIKTVYIERAPANPIKYCVWFIYFLRKMAKCDILHVMSPTGANKILVVAKLMHISTVCHWIGSDVLKLNDSHIKKTFFFSCPSKKVVHLTVAEHLGQELAEYGIKTEVVPNITDAVIAEPEPLPMVPAVLSYWHDKRAVFFNASTVFELAKCFPDVPFRIVGTTGGGCTAPQNVEFLGYLEDVSKVLSRSTVYIRLVSHDGQPMMVAEALAKGRYVLYNHPAPHCVYVQTISEVKDALSEILKKTQPNIVGAEFVRRQMSPEANIKRLIKIYAQLVKQ